MGQVGCSTGDRGGVTVVIPAYNAARYIEASVHSALAQTYPGLEVLVVDDGSTDDTVAICRRIAVDHPNLQVVSKPNGGVASARNLGTLRARTPYVAYLDADDLWHPAKIERQMAQLMSHGGEPAWVGCYALYRQIGPDDELISNGANWGPSGDFFTEHLSLNHIANGSSLLVSREAALEVGGFDETHVARGVGGCEDYDFQLKLLKKYKIDLAPEFLVGYRSHPDQMSANYSRMGRGLTEILDKFLDGSDLDDRQKRKARVAARSAASMEFLRGKDWRRFAHVVLEIGRTDPVAGAGQAAHFAWRAVRSRSIRLARWISAKASLSKSTSPRFLELSPRDGLPRQL